MPRVSKQRASLCECGNHAWLRMRKGVTLVDPPFAHHLDSNGWSVNSDGYAKGKRAGTLHRNLTSAKTGEHVDHINHDRLDNRMSNLRVCGPEGNMHNRAKLPTYGRRPSKYKGVTSQNKDLWMARIAAHGVRHYLGTFKTQEDAARAYNLAAIKHHGDFAVLNEVEA